MDMIIWFSGNSISRRHTRYVKTVTANLCLGKNDFPGSYDKSHFMKSPIYLCDDPFPKCITQSLPSLSDSSINIPLGWIRSLLPISPLNLFMANLQSFDLLPIPSFNLNNNTPTPSLIFTSVVCHSFSVK